VFVAAIGSLVSFLPTPLMQWVKDKVFIAAWNQSPHAAGGCLLLEPGQLTAGLKDVKEI
jgi:hypothetical protein